MSDHKTMDGCVVLDGHKFGMDDAKAYLQEMGFSYSEAVDYIRSLPVKRSK